MLTAAALQKYWDENPDKLAEAAKANPTAFAPQQQEKKSVFGANFDYNNLDAAGKQKFDTALSTNANFLSSFGKDPATSPAAPAATPYQPTGRKEDEEKDRDFYLQQVMDPNFLNSLEAGSTQGDLNADLQARLDASGAKTPAEIAKIVRSMENVEGKDFMGGDKTYRPSARIAVDYALSNDIELVAAHGDNGQYKIQDLGLAAGNIKNSGDAYKADYTDYLASKGLLPDFGGAGADVQYQDDGTYRIKLDEHKGGWGSQLVEMAFTKGIPLAASTLLTGGIANPWIAGAAGGGLNTAMSGGDATDIVKGAATGGLTSGVIGEVPGIGDAYKSSNVGGSFVRGATNDSVSQLIQSGKLDPVEAAKAGGWNMLKDVGKDAFQDTLQTNDDNLKVGGDTLNNLPMTPEDVARLTNTSDLYGILGEEGLLSKAGINLGGEDGFLFDESGYLKTGLGGDAMDFLGIGGRPAVDPGGELADKYSKDMEGISSDPSLTYAQKLEAVQNVKNDYYAATSRYDERFFDITSERGDSPLTGIQETNPYAVANTSTGSGGSFGQGLPGVSSPGITSGPDYSSQLTPQSDEAFQEFMGSNPTASIDGETFVTDRELQGADDGGLTYDPSTQDNLPNVSEGEYQQASGEGAATQLPSGSGSQALPDVPFNQLPDTVINEIVQLTSSFSSPTGGSGGGGAGTGLHGPAPSAKEDDEEMFRLASIMKIEGVPENIAKAAQSRMKGIIARKDARVEGDATAMLDPESKRFIQRYKADTKKQLRAATETDPVQQALDEVAAG